MLDRSARTLAAVALTAIVLAAAFLPAGEAAAQQRGGVLKIAHMDNPPGVSVHEEGSISVVGPFMAVFNGLAVYDQNIEQNRLDTIRPDLATGWTSSDDGLRLTFTLRPDVRWHDGKPFTARDVKCTWDLLMGKSEQKFRKNPRQAWWNNVDEVTTNGDLEAIFRLKRPQPALIALMATGWTAVYPCHVSPTEMRAHPIGTGPFRFVEFRPNDSIRLERNPDYWKPERPYLDGIEYKIIPARATRTLAFIAGDFDMTFPTDVSAAVMREIMQQAPDTQCRLEPTNATTNLLINRDAPPFDNPDIRRALALSLDRQHFIDIIAEGKAVIGGAMLAPPAGVWGLPPEALKGVVGYGDVQADREKAREIMRKLGYSPEKPLKLKVSTRNISQFRDPAVILIDQLKEIYVDAELEVVETSIYYNKVLKKDYAVALNLTGSAVDDPDQNFYENYACGSQRNFNGYCNKDMEALFDKQSMEADLEKRREMVWDIDRKLQEDVARPIIFHGAQADCWHPRVKGRTMMINSVYNGWRYEDIWLEK